MADEYEASSAVLQETILQTAKSVKNFLIRFCDIVSIDFYEDSDALVFRCDRIHHRELVELFRLVLYILERTEAEVLADMLNISF